MTVIVFIVRREDKIDFILGFLNERTPSEGNFLSRLAFSKTLLRAEHSTSRFDNHTILAVQKKN